MKKKEKEIPFSQWSDHLGCIEFDYDHEAAVRLLRHVVESPLPCITAFREAMKGSNCLEIHERPSVRACKQSGQFGAETLSHLQQIPLLYTVQYILYYNY